MYVLPEMDDSLDGYLASAGAVCSSRSAPNRLMHPCCFDKLSDKFEELHIWCRLLNLITLRTRYHIPRPGWTGEYTTISRITGPGRVEIYHAITGLVEVYYITDKLWLKRLILQDGR
jgi:hypothetical protein